MLVCSECDLRVCHRHTRHDAPKNLEVYRPQRANGLSPLIATHPKNRPATLVFATLPNSLDLKSFVCHTSEKQGGVGVLLLTSSRPVASQPFFTAPGRARTE